MKATNLTNVLSEIIKQQHKVTPPPGPGRGVRTSAGCNDPPPPQLYKESNRLFPDLNSFRNHWGSTKPKWYTCTVKCKVHAHGSHINRNL